MHLSAKPPAQARLKDERPRVPLSLTKWQSYGATNHDETPFLQRVSQWQREKEKDAAARKVDGEVRVCYSAPDNKTLQNTLVSYNA